jgi:uncharacterized membrane protein
MYFGLLFLNPLAGAAIGAASGAHSGKLSDLGINGKFLKDVASNLDTGKAALLLLIRKAMTDKVLAAMAGTGGAVMQSSFDETKEEALQAALSAAQQAAKPA